MPFCPLLLALVAVGCEGSAVAPPPGATGIPGGPSVYQAVLARLATLDAADLYTYVDGETVYVQRTSGGVKKSDLVAYQIRSDVRSRELPAGILESFFENNKTPRRIPCAALRGPSVTAGDFELRYGIDYYRREFPDAKVIVRFSQPGYTPDGRYALIRFSISPTPHGATGTCLLRATDAGWVVEWFETAYYL